MITDQEIVPGIVLHLDPDELEDNGGTYTCAEGLRVRGGHFFLCLTAADGVGTWLPLYSNDGDGRTLLSTSGRTGHKKWTNGTFYWHRGQVWSSAHSAVVAAAATGGDMSQAGSRNMLDVSELPTTGDS